MREKLKWLVLTVVFTIVVSIGAVGLRTTKQRPQQHFPAHTGATIQKNSNDVSIDFESCLPDSGQVYTEFATTLLVVNGADGLYCDFGYAYAVENPNPIVKLNTVCSVPRSVGIVRFPLASEGVMLEGRPLSPYCKPNK
jgi:hypothetical protein